KSLSCTMVLPCQAAGSCRTGSGLSTISTQCGSIRHAYSPTPATVATTPPAVYHSQRRRVTRFFTALSGVGSGMSNPGGHLRQLPLPALHFFQLDGIGEIEVQRRDCNHPLGKRRHVALSNIRRCGYIRGDPEIGSTPRISPAIVFLRIGRSPLGNDAHSQRRTLVQDRDVDVKQCPRLRLASEQLLNHLPPDLGGHGKVKLG